MLKRLSVVLLVLLVSLSAGVVFAFWDQLSAQQSQTVEISEGITLSVSEVVGTGNLVPVGAVLKANDVTSVTNTYTVSLDKQAIEDLVLTVTTSNVKVDSDANATAIALVNISVVYGTVINNNSPATVTVKVSLAKTAKDLTEDNYDLIAGKIITFDLNFTAVSANLAS